jgi:hypothetical protein
MSDTKLKINAQSIRTELKSYENDPLKCLIEYIWNSFDADATEIHLNFELPEEGIGYANNVCIIDNGRGWDFNDDATTNNFMSSTKQPRKGNTLPKGQYGRGRYTFIWIAEKLTAYSKGKKLTLLHNTEITKEDYEYSQSGTKICFDGIKTSFSSLLLSPNLHKQLCLEFCWFLRESSHYKILINNAELPISELIKDSKTYTNNELPEKLRNEIDDAFNAEIVLWNEKPSEYSKFYFLTNTSGELYKQNTGLNKKSDHFWHSVYIKSSLFNSVEDVIEEDNDSNQTNLSFDAKKTKRIKNQIIEFLKEELVKLRKPYLIIQSDQLLKELKEEQLIPNLPDFGIYDEESYGDLLKTIYTITPSLFVGKSNPEKKFICATFAGLLSTQDDILIQTILEQLQELSEDEKGDLIEILKRTSLSNVIKTIKEIDHRLEVINKLKVLISVHEKETLEVKHIQKILDDNFWLFGEQFRLFSSTEGALKSVLIKYATEILGITDPELNSNPNGEVDLFLTKTESIGEGIQKNVIVEIKRASIKLGKEQYDQIEGYMEKIITQNICNGENQFWEFYLVGKDYNDHIGNKIDSAKNHGQKERGLCYNIKDGRVKIYVRKWSDILEAEWGAKMKYLKEKLQIQAKQAKNSPQEITDDLIHNNSVVQND